MFDLGWTELLLIGTVALIVVGPKDLPGMFRTVGKFVGKAKGMAREFSKAMNDAADESGVRDVTDTLRKATNPVGSAMDEVRKSATSFTQATQDAGKPKDKPDAPKAAESGLSTERQAEIDAIRKKTSETALARQSAEKAAAEAAPDTTTQDGAKKPAPRKAAAPKTAKKPAPAPRKTAAAKTTTSKAASAKKPAASKPATKRASKPRTTAKGPSAKQSQTPESKA